MRGNAQQIKLKNYNEIGQVTANAQEGTTTKYDVYGQVTGVHNTSSGFPMTTFLYNDKGLRAQRRGYRSVELYV